MRPAESPVALRGDLLLEAVTDAIVALHLRYYHRVPTTAKTRLLGEDLIACSLGGIYTDVEKTMIELEHEDVVRDTRRDFQEATQQKFITIVERLSGRNVTAFSSHHHVGPDMAVAIFLLESEDEPPLP